MQVLGFAEDMHHLQLPDGPLFHKSRCTTSSRKDELYVPKPWVPMSRRGSKRLATRLNPRVSLPKPGRANLANFCRKPFVQEYNIIPRTCRVLRHQLLNSMSSASPASPQSHSLSYVPYPARRHLQPHLYNSRLSPTTSSLAPTGVKANRSLDRVAAIPSISHLNCTEVPSPQLPTGRPPARANPPPSPTSIPLSSVRRSSQPGLTLE